MFNDLVTRIPETTKISPKVSLAHCVESVNAAAKPATCNNDAKLNSRRHIPYLTCINAGVHQLMYMFARTCGAWAARDLCVFSKSLCSLIRIDCAHT